MNSKNLGLSMAVILGLALTSASLFQTQIAEAQLERVEGEITAPSNDKPFGGATIGDLTILGTEEGINVGVQLMAPSQSEGTVLEGWLVDNETGYKLSMGLLRDSTLSFSQGMVNPLLYNELVITEEPEGDTDPNPATPVGGTVLPSPFGQ